jgi:hypothetical protein
VHSGDIPVSDLLTGLIAIVGEDGVLSGKALAERPRS